MDSQAILDALRAGRIGPVSFADWLREIGASTNIETLSQKLPNWE